MGRLGVRPPRGVRVAAYQRRKDLGNDKQIAALRNELRMLQALPPREEDIKRIAAIKKVLQKYWGVDL